MALQTSLCLLLVKGSLISASGFTTTPLKTLILGVCKYIFVGGLHKHNSPIDVANDTRGLLLQMRIHEESTIWKFVMISQTRLLINLMPSWHLSGVLLLPRQSVKFRHLLNTGFFFRPQALKQEQSIPFFFKNQQNVLMSFKVFLLVV